jgi:hypothetical protein
MNISAVSSNSFDSSAASEMRKKMFQKSDSNSDGTLSKSELDTSVKNNAKKKGDPNADNIDTAKMFKSIDTNGDEKITESEMDSAMSRGPQAGTSGAKSSASTDSSTEASSTTSSSSSSSTSGSYSAADTNQDGTVSSEEETTYRADHPAIDDMDSDMNGSVTAEEESKYLAQHPEVAAKLAAREKPAMAMRPPNSDGTGRVINTSV